LSGRGLILKSELKKKHNQKNPDKKEMKGHKRDKRIKKSNEGGR
jgi:hypothetical protein